MISCGKERAACRNIMIKNGVEIDGSASAIQVLTSFYAENILNSGIMIATKGSIIASSRMLIKISFPLSW